MVLIPHCLYTMALWHTTTTLTFLTQRHTMKLTIFEIDFTSAVHSQAMAHCPNCHEPEALQRDEISDLNGHSN